MLSLIDQIHLTVLHAMNTHEMPEWAQRLYRPKRYKVPHGGRGSSKSWTVARVLVQIALQPQLLFPDRDKIRILCAREFQNSIEESVHHLLQTQIDNMGLLPWYNVETRAITSNNGSEFIFSGIRSNVTKIKSMEDIQLCWVEEAEKVSNNSWEVLIPTIRQAGSEIWITFNPDEEADPTYQRFVINKPDDCDSFLVNWRDNPWFPPELKKEMEYLFRVDPEAAQHVWEGACNTRSNAVIFRGKYKSELFTPITDSDFDEDNWLGPYYGADWGFAEDPTTLMKLWTSPSKSQQHNLYIEKESWGLHVELDDIAPKWRKDIPEIDHNYPTIRADCARPETISHVRNKGGLNVIGAEKWTGSVEDGIAFLRSFENIIIHPRCQHMLEEARLYKYKVDKITGDVLADIVDKHNHCWDSNRYALEPAIQRKKSIYDLV